MFDLSISKLFFLAIIALIVFGPNELPKIAAQAGRALRDLRRIAEGAKADLKEGLGPEFQDFDFDDLNPRRFVQKHLLDEPVTTSPAPAGAHVNGAGMGGAAGATTAGATTTEATTTEATTTEATTTEATMTGGATGAVNGKPPVLGAGEEPPFDFEAT